MTLQARAAIRFAIIFPILGVVVIGPARSWSYWQGWLFIAEMALFTALCTWYLFRRDPALLQRRLSTKETAWQQKLFRLLWVTLWTGGFLVAGWDFRFGWTSASLAPVPLPLTVLSHCGIACGFLLIFLTLKTNTYASSVINVESGQQVITTGPYGVVRHPMYSGLLLLDLFIAPALGSYMALPLFLLGVPTLLLRLIHEESLLRKELPGYDAYCLRTRFRLIPFVY